MKNPLLARGLASGLLLLIIPPASLRAQEAKDLVGSWSLVSAVNEQGAVKTNVYGPSPKGLMTFDASGHFSTVYIAAELPKFAANSRTAGTAEENQAVVRGSLAYLGTYVASAADKSLVYHLEASTFPNWTGTEQKRAFAILGDQLTITNPTPSTGGGTITLIYQRTR